MPLNYTPLVQMLQHASLKLQYPSITVRTEDGQKIKIKLAAKGYLAIVLNGDYVGKIEKDGTLILYQDKELISTVLSELNEDPYAFTKAQGLRYGFCCFCAKELTDPQSVSCGYGPICAETFGLPWGEDKPQASEVLLDGLDEAFNDKAGTGMTFPNIFNKAPEWPSIRQPVEPEAIQEEILKLSGNMVSIPIGKPLGEAEQMLKDIDNASIDLRIEGARSMLEFIIDLWNHGIIETDTIYTSAEDFINQMENLKS